MKKLSICIPVYNYDCSALVKSLLDLMDAGMELLVGDDGSTPSFSQRYGPTLEEYTHSTLQTKGFQPQWRVVTAEENIGRAAIRNLLADEANGEWLLFMDCDAKLPDKLFLERYLAEIRDMDEDAPFDVLCGGTASPDVCPSPAVSLRWTYENRYWNRQSVTQRQAAPYLSFTTFNFVVRLKTFECIRFNEACKGYGHEDTLFGNDLKMATVPVRHIANPLIHMGLDSNEAFLLKTEEQLRGLLRFKHELAANYTLLIYYARAKRLKMAWTLRLWHRLFAGIERRNLLSDHPSLRLFALYKLGYFATIDGQK